MLSPFRSYGEGGVEIDVNWARVLLKHGANVNLRDKNGNTALMLAASTNTSGEELEQFTKLLLKHGARVDFRNAAGLNASQIAQKSDFVSAAKLLKYAAS